MAFRNAVFGSLHSGGLGSGLGRSGGGMGAGSPLGGPGVTGNFGGVATTRQGGASLVPTPLKGGVTLPNFQRMQQMFMMKRAENPEDYNAEKMAGGGKFARQPFAAGTWHG